MALAGRSDDQDQLGVIDQIRAVFGRTYAAGPDRLVEQLRADEAIAEADPLLSTMPSQLGVDYAAIGENFDVILGRHAVVASVTIRQKMVGVEYDR